MRLFSSPARASVRLYCYRYHRTVLRSRHDILKCGAQRISRKSHARDGSRGPRSANTKHRASAETRNREKGILGNAWNILLNEYK